MPRIVLPHLTLPRRVRVGRRATGAAVVGLLVLSLGTAATAVTAELVSSPHVVPAANAATTPAVVVAPTTRAVAHTAPLSTKPKHLIAATLLVSGRHSLTHHQLRQLRKVAGVRKTQTVTAGHARVDGHPAFVVGVNPQTFRPWTPKLTADSNPLWSSVSNGDLTASFDMGSNAKLPLGQSVSVTSHSGVTPIRLGAFASVGMAGVDAVVSNDRARQIGLMPRSGLLISAPKADPLVVRKAVAQILGKHAHAELLREVVVTRDAGEFETRTQISDFLHEVASRVGAPYVWGATGPNAFDCSGLVQWAYAQIGIRMPRVAQEQFFTGPHIPYADARPGDLIFYHFEPNDPTFVSHVVVYIGDGMMIEAPHTGELVKEAPVPLNDMAGVVRVDPALAAQIA
jgi:peptidoglycan DL-endopeptidase CwlO